VPAGVFGEAMAPSGIAWGVDAETWSETYEAAGLKAIARHSTGQALGAIIENRSSNGIGLRVSMPDHLNDLGIDCQGRLVTTGGIGVSGPSKDGAREAYAALASEHVIQDMGDSHLSSGAARIDLDEIFLEKVTIDDKNPMRVMVTFYGPHGSYYVERSRTGFDVIEDSGSDAEFSWFVIAKRKGLEDKRLELADVPQ
jgi:hypothetical protein